MVSGLETIKKLKADHVQFGEDMSTRFTYLKGCYTLTPEGSNSTNWLKSKGNRDWLTVKHNLLTVKRTVEQTISGGAGHFFSGGLQGIISLS